MLITTSDIQNRFGLYLKMSEYEDVIITKNGKKVAKLSAFNEEDECLLRESSADYAYAHEKVSYEEYIKLTKDSEQRYELINGVVYFLDSPLYPHQKAIKEILTEFVLWFRDKKCEPLTAPFDVTLHKSENNICVVQPDILVICDREKIDEGGKYSGVPTLVVEVLSKSTSSKDNLTKLELYMVTGVKEYWIVNTETKEIYIYALGDNQVRHVMSYTGNQRAQSRCFNGLGIDLQRVFI